MKRYFFEISFDGTAYSGWQRQKTVPTIQQTIEDQLEILLQRPVRIHGCGRTDAGVHASQYFFHIDLEMDPVTILFKLNRMIPRSIAILRFIEVAPKANAQKDAILRTYEYTISSAENPFNHQFSAFVFEELDHNLMSKGLNMITGKHDFKNFCKRPEIMDNTICHIESATMVTLAEGNAIKIIVSGNRFLHHMMRLLVGNLIKVGSGKLSIDEFKENIDLKSTPKFFQLAPAQGLVLSKVEYPEIHINVRTGEG